MKYIFSLIAIIAALIIFFGPVRTTYGDRIPIIDERASLEQALENAKQIQLKRDSLQAKFNNIPSSDIARLHKKTFDDHWKRVK